MFHTNLRKRNLYLQQLKAFRDTEKVKIISGIRHCGKPSLMKLTADHLRECGIGDNQIIEIKVLPLPFREFLDFHGYTVTERRSPVGGMRKRILDADVESYDPRERKLLPKWTQTPAPWS